jgi:hypothetical protein
MTDKTIMTIPEMNREMCGHLKLCWHEKDPFVDFAPFRFKCKHCQEIIDWQDAHPDFSTDSGKVRLLREMERVIDKEDFEKFWLVGLHNVHPSLMKFLTTGAKVRMLETIPKNYITDDTPEGKVRLLKAALEFMERGK